MKIGLEIHVQLNTETKLFCGCANKHDNEPNSVVCEYCIGSPGSKPVLNSKTIGYAIKIALALKSNIPNKMVFSRKNYFYPDMAKNFQTTQYEFPIALEGSVDLDSKKINITRIQLEEDPARIVHMRDYVLVDYNRSGVPLCEIVTEPDFTSPKEARLFLQRLSNMLEYLGVMNSSVEGSLRVDANISTGSNRVEIKNITGFRDVEKALNYEIIRQKNQINRGQEVKRETRGWDADLGVTKSMRSKEEEADYGYITDPDLPIFNLDKNLISEIEKSLPEMPHEKIERYMESMNEIMARSIASDLSLAQCYEKVSEKIDKVLAAKWFAGYIKKTLNYSDVDLKDINLTSDEIISLIGSVSSGKITDKMGEMILRERVKGGDIPSLIEKSSSISKEDLYSIVSKVIEKNEKVVNEYNSGKKESLNFLIGQIMKETKGRANPDEIKKLVLDNI